MLASYPIKINNTAIPFPDSWEENPRKISNEFSMENGDRKKIGIRNKLMSISASFTVSSRWLKRFEAWRDAATLTVSIYDARLTGYVNYTMEIMDDSFTYNLIKNSKRIRNTDGLWRVSFDLEEF